MPRIGGGEHLWMNGIYDAVCAIVLFPAIVWLAASGRTTDRITTRVCKFLGDISYPLYMVHYPFIYLYYAWVKNEELTFAESLARRCGAGRGLGSAGMAVSETLRRTRPPLPVEAPAADRKTMIHINQATI